MYLMVRVWSPWGSVTMRVTAPTNTGFAKVWVGFSPFVGGQFRRGAREDVENNKLLLRHVFADVPALFFAELVAPSGKVQW